MYVRMYVCMYVCIIAYYATGQHNTFTYTQTKIYIDKHAE